MENKRGKIFRILLILIVLVGGYLAIYLLPIEWLTRLNVQNINYSIIIFIIQWFIIMIIIYYTYLKYIRNKSKEKKKVEISQKMVQKKASQTDFDVLYDLLKEEKSLSIEAIATIFTIKREIALEWAKILESNNLATVEYPAFGDPEVMLKEEEEEEGKKKSKKSTRKAKRSKKEVKKHIKKMRDRIKK